MPGSPRSWFTSTRTRTPKPIPIRRTLLTLLALSITLLVPLFTASTAGADAAELDPSMAALWQRTDGPVAAHEVDRSWLWGPQANHILQEPYTFDGRTSRLVAYYDKSRMEINDPEGDSSQPWHVTNGRLVYEMMTGRVQVGQDPDQYTVSLPAAIPVAGDPYSASTPTYQALGRLMAGAPERTGQVVTATVDAFGSVGADLAPPESLKNSEYISYTGEDGTEVGHNIPDVFAAFLNDQIGPLAGEAGWLYVTGYPLTEPYWAKETLNQQETDVLVQCFERRCLTYTPSNAEPFKVEMGNVGQHYYRWRYEHYSMECANVAVRGFGALWSQNAEVRTAVGCPEVLTGEQAIHTAYERFEHGLMIWIDVRDAYNPAKSVLVLYDDGTFVRYQDTWEEGQAASDPSMTPPAGLEQPVRGFGKVWREVPGVRDRLGWATGPEHGSDGAYQRFNFGTMVWLKDFDRIWVFQGDLYWNANGTWQVYDDPYQG